MGKKSRLWTVLFMLTMLIMTVAACSKETPSEDVCLSDCKIVYDKSDYMSKRYAYRLYNKVKTLMGKTMEYTSDSAEIELGKTIVFKEDTSLEQGTARIDVKDNNITCLVNSYYGFEAILDYLDATYEKGTDYVLADGFSWEGSYLDTLEDSEASDVYAYNKTGDYRVMFNNVLWRASGNIANDKPGERNVLTVEMIKQYQPDVIGMQECDVTKRDEVKEQNMGLLMEELGYAEVQVTVDNAVGVNCTPIFYKTDTMIPVTGGYLNYKNQPYQETDKNQSSKSLTWCLFEAVNGDKFIVISTHLETRYSSVRYNQAEEASELIDALKEKYNVPIIFGGDYNTVTGSTTFQYLVNTAGYTDVTEIAEEFSSIVKPNHSYPQYKILKDITDFNGMHGLSGEVILNEGGMGVDHIVVENEESMQLSVYGVVVDDCTKAASDHLPTFIDFTIKE